MKRRAFLLLLAAASLLFLSPLRGADQLKYLSAGCPDVVALLPPPPAAGSAEAAADLATTRAASQARTPEQKAAIAAEVDLTIFRFSAAIGPWFESGRFPKTEAFFKQVGSDTRVVTNEGKAYFQHPRPYVVDPTIVPMAPENSFSYPSGHATRGTVFSLVLAELFPANREALLRIGRDIGWDRIVAGVHSPSDIFSGRVLGQAIVREMLKSPQFLRDLAGAKVELATVRPEPSAAPR
jgi:acid phosphatase (class A)